MNDVTPELQVAKTVMSTVDKAVLKTWQDYIRATEAEIQSIRRGNTWLLIGVSSLCLILGFTLGWMVGRGILTF